MVTEEMLGAARNYLDITFRDSDTEEKLRGILERGQRYLNDVAGEDLNYEREDTPRAMLFDYCRYARNNALELFEENFKRELVALRIGVQVKNYAEGQGYI